MRKRLLNPIGDYGMVGMSLNREETKQKIE